MESISKFSLSHQPVRSISLPSRTHPSSQRIEALLNNLKLHHSQSFSRTSTCFEAEEIQGNMVVLAELYNSMEELFQSPQTQQALARYQDGKLVEESLSGSVTLLDGCGSARDLLPALREHVQSIQSAIRRRRTGDLSMESSVSAYDIFRRKAKKEISKQIVQLKKMEKNKVGSISLLGQDQEIIFLARILREASTITISILCCLLEFMSMPALGTKGSSLISKLKSKRLFSSSEKKNSDEIADLNTALCSLMGREKKSDSKGEEVQGAMRVLEALNVDIEGLGNGLDSIFRCLVRNRVLFLNMVAHN